MPNMGGTRRKDRTDWDEVGRASCGLPTNRDASPAANAIIADDPSCGGEPEVGVGIWEGVECGLLSAERRRRQRRLKLTLEMELCSVSFDEE